MLLPAFLSIATIRQRIQDQIIVFSASRYAENVGKVYPSGRTHLYSIRPSGTGLKQLTTGDCSDIVPALSKDGRHILFWRCKADVYEDEFFEGSDNFFELCSVDLNGNDQHRLNFRIFGIPPTGLAEAFERYKPGTITSVLNPSGHLRIHSKDRSVTVGMVDLFSPNGSHVFAYPDDYVKKLVDYDVRFIDVATGRTIALNDKYYSPAWIDDKTFVATLGGTQTLVILSATGREQLRKRIKYSMPKLDYEVTPFDGRPEDRRAFSLGSTGLFLLEIRLPSSDGGYNYFFRVDMNLGTAKFIAQQTIEAMSLDGLYFLTAKYGWVDGYHGLGAGKLCKLFLWDAKKLTSEPIGFRLMTCFGACFATAPGKP